MIHQCKILIQRACIVDNPEPLITTDFTFYDGNCKKKPIGTWLATPISHLNGNSWHSQRWSFKMVKTRNIVHDDGRLEIRRVISADSLVDWEQDNPLAFERSIVWIRPVLDLPYVRTAFVKNARSRRGPLLTASADQTVVGYSKLTADAPMQGLDYLYYQRRVFYLTSQDIEGVADVNASVNCIQPSTILPTVWGAS